MAERKFQPTDFIETNSFSGMNVSSASRLFSGTMQAMVRRVADDTDLFPLPSHLSHHHDRQSLFRPLLEMMERVNRMFDLCNGIEGNNIWLSFNSVNGEKYAKEFLHILRWFVEWERDVAGSSNLSLKSNFIAKETMKALKYVCLGFACIIYHECISGKRRISPSKLNQDIVEHHFANVRRNCQSHANPTEI